MTGARADATQPPLGTSLPRATSAPAFRDWTDKWDAMPTGAAGPRYSQGSECLSRTKDKVRETYIDKQKRLTAWVPGPGTHRTVRWPDVSPSRSRKDGDVTDLRREAGEESRMATTMGEWGSKTIPHKFSRAVRQASLSSLKKQRTTLLPSSYLTPGPGKYCAFTTFGAPSGGSRRRYFATNTEDNMGKGRPAEAYHRHADDLRGFN